MGDIIIDLPIEGHDPFERAHRPIGPPQQAPDPEPSRIGMPLLEVIDLQHEWQPDFAGGSLGGEALVHETREVLRLKAVNPPINRRARDVKDPPDTALGPALIIEFNDLDPRLIAVTLAVIVAQRQFFLHGRLALLPEPLRRRGMQTVATLGENDPDDFPILKA